MRAARLAIDEINAEGGVGGRDLKLVVYDDANNADIARRRAEEIAADDRILLVIGHNDSDAALAAAGIYRTAGIPAISPAAAADLITLDNPWYFSVVLDTTAQGTFVGDYARTVLGFTNASVIRANGTYSSGIATGFDAAFRAGGGTIEHTWTIDPAQREQSIQAIAAGLAADSDPGIVFVALTVSDARDLLLTTRRQGIVVPMFGAPSIASEVFPSLFEDEPEEQDQPGFFTNGLYAGSPLIYDSIGGHALAFADRFRAEYVTSPDWHGAKVFEAMSLAARSIDTGDLDADAGAASNRQRVRDALAGVNTPEAAIPGLGRRLYFNQRGIVPQALSVGQFDRGHLASTPVQYHLVTEPALHDLDADRAAGKLLEFNGATLRQHRVAYIGLDINEFSNLDTAAQTYSADFFLWIRYTGDVSAADIIFTNSSDPALPIGEPIQSSQTGDETFAMYRVQGSFHQPLDFHDYPWDVHLLQIGFQNQSLNNNEIVFVVDQPVLGQSQDERLRSGFDLSARFNNIPNWEATGVWFSQELQTSRSVVPDPQTGAPGYVEFSEFQVDVTFQRDVQSFLIKNLLPLALLTLVTYISLFFPPDQAGARIGFAITAILTTSVLLGSISSRLPDIGYTVAIEWGFYAYIGFSTVLVLFNIVVERLYQQKRYASVRRLDVAARILYPAFVVAVIALYVVNYA